MIRNIPPPPPPFSTLLTILYMKVTYYLTEEMLILPPKHIFADFLTAYIFALRKESFNVARDKTIFSIYLFSLLVFSMFKFTKSSYFMYLALYD